MRRRAIESVVGLTFAVALGAVACGGKVTFVTGGAGTGGGGGGPTSGSQATSSGSGLPACLPETKPGGPMGPHTITGSKCFEWTESKPCPETVVAGPHIAVDPCYLLESVDQQCAPDTGECCYNITETSYCK
ncbi:MAG: hypothetical protein U0414_07960 [Polyangiaceae bacterium]